MTNINFDFQYLFGLFGFVVQESPCVVEHFLAVVMFLFVHLTLVLQVKGVS